MWRKKEIMQMQVQKELAEQKQVFIPKDTFEQLKTKAFLEMHEKLLKLEEEVRLLTQIIRDYELNKVSGS